MVNQDTKWDEVQSAIARAESQTSAELVVTVVKTSGRYESLAWGLACALLLLCLLGHLDAWIYHHLVPFSWPSWTGLAALSALSVWLGLLLSKLPAVIRMFSSSATLSRWSELRAEVEFFEKIHGHTAGNTGVLIFVSLTERRALILADKIVMQNMDSQFLNSHLKELLTSLAKGDLIGGLTKTVLDIGEILKTKLPILPGDVNELDNRVIFLEQ